MLRKLYNTLWLGAPIAMWFAYQPLIRLGQDGTMNYELSIAMLYVAVMALAGVPMVWRARRELVQSRAVWLVGSVVIIALASLLWTANLTRGVLTVGVTGLLFLIFLAALAEKEDLGRMMPKIVRVYLWGALVMCALATVQFFAGIWLDAETTLLCAGCVAEQFGFVRPNAFLIEPQFLGNALLPAALLLAHRLTTRGFNWQTIAALFAIMLTLVLTLSRGALLACAVGLLVLFLLNWRSVKRWLAVAGVIVLSGASALTLQGAAAALNPAIDETFVGATSKSLHQLSMGVIDLRPAEVPELPAKPDEALPKNADEQPTEPHFDGYVEESTTARTTRTTMALERWRADIPTILFGVGVGSAGVRMHERFPEQIGAREIVQNEYVEVLLERGIIGLASFLAMLVGLLIASKNQRWLWAIIAAIMTQWLFFSGYPNALHAYLALILIAVATRRRDPSALARRYS